MSSALLHTRNQKETLVILTLERHRHGIWITRLVESLKQQYDDDGTDISVVTLESLLGGNKSACFDPAQFLQNESTTNIVAVINRVSDAAEPILYKACLAVLHAVKVMGIPVWNGPESYALCGNKWCHHVLFQQAGLQSPRTLGMFRPNPTRLHETATKMMLEGENTSSSSCSFPHLIKPNSGGFGQGIVRVNKMEQLVSSSSQHVVEQYEDDMALYQDYVPPYKNELHRIWFLCGKVQCGVVRTQRQQQIISDNDDEQDEKDTKDGVSSEFTSGCAAGRVCLRQSSSARPSSKKGWIMMPYCPIHPDVILELEEHLLPLIPDAQAGSVEFLYNDLGQRLYFDLNLLSTLPIPKNIFVPHKSASENNGWADGYDPWKELAQAIVEFVEERQKNIHDDS